MAEHREVIWAALNHTLHGAISELPLIGEGDSERDFLYHAAHAWDVENSGRAAVSHPR